MLRIKRLLEMHLERPDDNRIKRTLHKAMDITSMRLYNKRDSVSQSLSAIDLTLSYVDSLAEQIVESRYWTCSDIEKLRELIDYYEKRDMGNLSLIRLIDGILLQRAYTEQTGLANPPPSNYRTPSTYRYCGDEVISKMVNTCDKFLYANPEERHTLGLTPRRVVISIRSKLTSHEIPSNIAKIEATKIVLYSRATQEVLVKSTALQQFAHNIKCFFTLRWGHIGKTPAQLAANDLSRIFEGDRLHHETLQRRLTI